MENCYSTVRVSVSRPFALYHSKAFVLDIMGKRAENAAYKRYGRRQQRHASFCLANLERQVATRPTCKEAFLVIEPPGLAVSADSRAFSENCNPLVSMLFSQQLL